MSNPSIARFRSLPAASAGTPLSSASAQWLAAGLLALLMMATRGQHFASVDALPSASWAVFFLAGVLLRPRAAFVGFFALASLLDIGSLAAGTISDWCTSPAYWVLLPAYAALWAGGRHYATLHRDHWSTLPRLALVLIASAIVAYLISKGGFYFFSGRYPDATMTGFLLRVPQYFPPALGTLAGYVGVAMLAHFAVRALRRPAAARAAARA